MLDKDVTPAVVAVELAGPKVVTLVGVPAVGANVVPKEVLSVDGCKVTEESEDDERPETAVVTTRTCVDVVAVVAAEEAVDVVVEVV